MKQIHNGEIVDKIINKGSGYFHWLQDKSGLTGELSSMVAETEFVSHDGIDDILVERTKEEVRRRYADDIAEHEGLNDKETETVYKSIRGNCCLFEVILCLAFSLNEMFEDSDSFDGPSHFFGMMMKNAGFDLYDDEDLDLIGDQVKEYWQRVINRILDRSYDDTGKGGLFPLAWIEDYNDNRKTYTDRRLVSLWQQMNDWVDEHTNEDGEWVD